MKWDPKKLHRTTTSFLRSQILTTLKSSNTVLYFFSFLPRDFTQSLAVRVQSKGPWILPQPLQCPPHDMFVLLRFRTSGDMTSLQWRSRVEAHFDWWVKEWSKSIHIPCVKCGCQVSWLAKVVEFVNKANARTLELLRFWTKLFSKNILEVTESQMNYAADWRNIQYWALVLKRCVLCVFNAMQHPC